MSLSPSRRWLALAVFSLVSSVHGCQCNRPAQPAAHAGPTAAPRPDVEPVEPRPLFEELELTQSADCTAAITWAARVVRAQVLAGSFVRPTIDGGRWSRKEAVEFDERSSLRSDVPLPPFAPASEAAAPSVARSEEARAKAGTGAGADAAAPTSFTGTNVQEVGVDEADLVDTDGRYVYILHQGEVLVVKSWPVDDLQLVSRIPLDRDTTPTGIYLAGDRLVVVSIGAMRLAARSEAAGAVRSAQIVVFDVAKPEAPRVARRVRIEGQLVDSRLIGNDFYLVINAGATLPQGPIADARAWVQERDASWQSSADARARTEAELETFLESRLDAATITIALPWLGDSIGENGEESLRPAVGCDDVFVPNLKQEGGALLDVLHLRLDGDAPPDSTAILASGATIYASTEALYVAMPAYGVVASELRPWRGRSAGTLVHKFLLNRGNGRPAYRGGGEVPGTILNQFSMDEHQGAFRIATTDNSGGWRNGVYVLAEDDGRLTEQGSIENLAPGERIYAVRMFGERGYVVTFRQTDPLFTLDLADPKHPQVRGKLEIPGYSSYIHPLGQARLLTIGQDADSFGRVRGLHLQIFDVENLASPTRLHQHVFEPGAASEAELSHHAFTYDPATSTLAVPVSTVRGSSAAFIAAFHIHARDGFVELGRVDHNDLAAAFSNANCTAGGFVDGCNWSHLLTPLRRSIVMEKLLYTVSGYGMKVNATEASLPERAALALPVGPLPGMRGSPAPVTPPPVTIRIEPERPGPKITKLDGSGVTDLGPLRRAIETLLRRAVDRCGKGTAVIKIRFTVDAAGKIAGIEVVAGQETPQGTCLGKELAAVTSATRQSGSEPGIVELSVFWKLE